MHSHYSWSNIAERLTYAGHSWRRGHIDYDGKSLCLIQVGTENGETHITVAETAEICFAALEESILQK